MKLSKKILSLCMAAALCFGVGALTACGGNGGSSESSSSNEQSASGYLFKVVTADGQAPEVGVYQIQLCKGVESCFMPIALDENGTAMINESVIVGFPGAGVYDIHILGPELNEDGFPYAEYEGATVTPASYSSEYIVLTLK
jgi:hypothetical protein